MALFSIKSSMQRLMRSTAPADTNLCRIGRDAFLQRDLHVALAPDAVRQARSCSPTAAP